MSAIGDAKNIAGAAIPIGIGLAAIAGFVYWKVSDDQPKIDGKSAGAWISELRFGTESGQRKAASALRSLGNAAVKPLHDAIEEESKLPTAASPGARSRNDGFLLMARELAADIEAATKSPIPRPSP